MTGTDKRAPVERSKQTMRPRRSLGEERERRRLIAGVWSDGTVIWSDNRATGGKHFESGVVELLIQRPAMTFGHDALNQPP